MSVHCIFYLTELIYNCFRKLCLCHKTYFLCSQTNFSEPRCGPVTGAAISLPLAPCDVDAPQPLVDRRPSVSLLKWSSSKRNDASTPTVGRQGLDHFFF